MESRIATLARQEKRTDFLINNNRDDSETTENILAEMDGFKPEAAVAVECNTVPDNLKTFVLFIAKAFYGREHSVILDYIQEFTCVKEDELRLKLKFDQRFLRKILMQFKMDKILKERMACEEVEGRSRKIVHYYINYPATLNVVKYKIDHMRQRIEVKDKDKVHKACYKCSECSHSYDEMDMDKIYDPATDELRCWWCKGAIEQDESPGQDEEIRSSLAHFNDQMTPIFVMLQDVEKIRLAKHLLEPPAKSNGICRNDSDDKSSRVDQHAFNDYAFANRSLLRENGVTVSIEGQADASSMMEDEEGAEKKPIPPWLLLQLHEVANEDSNLSVEEPESNVGLQESGRSELPTNKSAKDEIEDMLMEEINDESRDCQPFLKSTTIGTSEAAEKSLNSEDEDVMVTVGGRQYYIEDLTPELVSQMTPSEKENYIRITREGFDF